LVRNEKELEEKLETLFSAVSQILVEEYLAGWKEVEYEVVRDRADKLHHGVQYGKYRSDGNPYGRIDSGGAIANAFQTPNTIRCVKSRRARSVTLASLVKCNIQYAP